jgi:hypothetical protein
LDSKFDSEHDSDVDMRMENDVDSPDGVDLDGDVDMKRDSDDEEKHDDAAEDKDENDGKEPWTIGQGEMVTTLGVDVHPMVDDQPIVLPEQGQEMHDHTQRRHPLASDPVPQTPEPCLQPRTLVTYPLSGLQHLGLVTPQKPTLAVPTLREAEGGGDTMDVDVDQQLLIESAGGDSLPDVPISDVPLA